MVVGSQDRRKRPIRNDLKSPEELNDSATFIQMGPNSSGQLDATKVWRARSKAPGCEYTAVARISRWVQGSPKSGIQYL
jgi:hypothetical protein